VFFEAIQAGGVVQQYIGIDNKKLAGADFFAAGLDDPLVLSRGGPEAGRPDAVF
jgi:hypothetical protein